MSQSIKSQTVLSIFAGVSIAVVAIFLLSYTLAIAVPNWLLDHPLAEGNTTAVLRLWDGLVVYLLAVGLPAFVLCMVLFKVFVAPGWRAFIAVLAGFLAYVHVIYPLMSKGQILVPGTGDFAWYAALLVNLIVGAALASMLMRSRTVSAD